MKQDPQTNNNVRFIVIGSVKCATTWISRCLKSHPEICMPDHKELKFFNRRDQYSQGINHYVNQFAHCDGAKAVGEFTPRYLHDGQEVAKRIHDAFPDAKLIVCLRDPIERAFSHYRYAKRKRNEPSNSFREAMNRRNDYRDWGLYAKQLKPYFDLFPKDQILILQYERIRGREQAFMEELYRFLGVDDRHVSPQLHTRVNKTSAIAYRFGAINRAINRVKKFFRRKTWGHHVLIAIQKSGLSRIATKLLGLNRKRNATPKPNPERMDETLRNELQEYYRGDMQELSRLSNIDIGLWMK